jgi:hypothetical protein
MSPKQYALYKYIFVEYGKDLLSELDKDSNKFSLPSLKELSKEYVDLVKSFLADMNKDVIDEQAIKKHIAILGKQHYKMYLKID